MTGWRGSWAAFRPSASRILPILIGLLLSYSTPLVLAYAVGEYAFGLYAYAIAWTGMLGLMCKWGFDVAATKFVALGRSGEARYPPGEVSRLLLAWTMAVSVPVALVFGSFAAVAAGRGGGQVLPVLAAGAALIPIVAMGMVRRNAALSAGASWAAELPENIGRSAGLLLLLPLLILHGFASPAYLALATVGVGALCLAVGLGWIARILPAEGTGVPPPSRREIVEYSATVGTSGMLIAGWSVIDIIIVGALFSDWQTVGTYALAARLAALCATFGALVDPLFAPAIAVARSRGDREATARLIYLYPLVAVGWAASALLGLAATGGLILLYVDADPQAYWTILIIGAGYLFGAGTGASHILLTMGGHHRLHLKITLVSVALSVVLVSAGAVFGLIGAAIGKALSIILMKILQLIMVRRRLNTDSSLAAHFRRQQSSASPRRRR